MNTSIATDCPNAWVAEDFHAIDEALYRLERPYYRACAGGAYFEVTQRWTIERERLIALWLQKCPWQALEPAKMPERGFLARLWAKLSK